MLKWNYPLMEHNWDVTVEEACAIQEQLARRIKLSSLKDTPRRVGGVAYRSISSDSVAIGIVVVSFPTMEILEEQGDVFSAPLPYKAGLAAFHAGPGIIKLFSNLKKKPDLLICLGHGIAHPRGFGLASHLGLLLSIPSFGCATSIFYGVPMGGIDAQRGEQVPLLSTGGDTIGIILRTRQGVHPLIVSPGYRVTLEEAVDITIKSTKRFRLPEPIRMAQQLAKKSSSR